LSGVGDNIIRCLLNWGLRRPSCFCNLGFSVFLGLFSRLWCTGNTNLPRSPFLSEISFLSLGKIMHRAHTLGIQKTRGKINTLVALRPPIDECSCLDAVKVLVENQKTSENTCTHTLVCAVPRRTLPLWHASCHALQLYV